MHYQYGVGGQPHDLLRYAANQSAADTAVAAATHDEQVTPGGFAGCKNFGKGFSRAHFAMCSHTRLERLFYQLRDRGLCLGA